ncbi:Metallo-dependent phosphatase [Basidiobolus meristosporus CBS 931.73]|uniref:Metallo-dependent phosphatase n=1 Tax=Basidiobolus meristosporus CBS 931.73 TaxID=1314790 RepID=A0A1Y1XY41_9FUNG|nr:Metallo-dependent phosphatase [Basidiobolus meristosporus CBS 931.73]|eukprot:ORX90668.1 Metallo-dependent phosphatase [Basidiobolus meristosporus CBS 931.73]
MTLSTEDHSSQRNHSIDEQNSETITQPQQSTLRRVVGKPYFYVILVCLLSLLVAKLQRPENLRLPDNDRRVVAVGDLHGDFDSALKVLQLAKLVDAEGSWAGGNDILVQTGDIVDRGPDTLRLYQYFFKLSAEAAKQGGMVVNLLGNHEIMNFAGDFRYVHPADDLGSSVEPRLDAFNSEGIIGSQLSHWNVTAIVADTVFSHADLHPRWAKHGIAKLNSIARKKLFGDHHSKEEREWRWRYFGGLFGDDGPVWYRGFALGENEAEVCHGIRETLELLNVKRMVVGHTTQRDGKVLTRCNGLYYVIDVGISRAYGNSMAALEINGDVVTLIYPE